MSSRAKVFEVLSRVPVRLTVPRVRLKAPRAAMVRGPPRAVVESVAEIVPRFVQAVDPEPRSREALEAEIEPVAALVQDLKSASFSPAEAASVALFSNEKALTEMVPVCVPPASADATRVSPEKTSIAEMMA